MATARHYHEALRRMGFSDKEASVYLASLELGPSSVMEIAKRSGVTRASTYVAIDSLKLMGLMSTHDHGKKVIFTPEPPENIARILNEQKREIEDKQDVFRGIVGDLLSLRSASTESHKVSFYEGVEGLLQIHDDILKTKDDVLENIVALDDAMKVNLPEEEITRFREKLVSAGIGVRILYTSNEKDLNLPADMRKKWKLRRISEKKFPLHGEITLYGDKLAGFAYKGKIYGVIIEGREIVQAIRVLFDIAWASDAAKKSADS